MDKIRRPSPTAIKEDDPYKTLTSMVLPSKVGMRGLVKRYCGGMPASQTQAELPKVKRIP